MLMNAVTDLPLPMTDLAHPLPNLCEMTAAEILAAYRTSQFNDVKQTLARVRSDAQDLTQEIGILKRYLAVHPHASFQQRLHIDTIEKLFRRMHDHVMSHPVWVHPFFVRMAEGNMTLGQLNVFARQYFNQVKNTRQCVALALGRFHTMMDRGEGRLSIIVSELTQLVLAGLVSDEYGTSAHGHGDSHSSAAPGSPSVDIGQLFASITHPGLFRRFLDALGASAADYDVPMLHAVADNVLVQRILSSDPAYDELEALASVGLGMEWGVPAFFSMIMAGIYKVTHREGITIDPRSMEIWSAHVKQDVEHAIAVMIATSFYVRDKADEVRIERATNVLLAYRYDMMSDIYREVFGLDCPKIAQIELNPRHLPDDRRIKPLLAAARERLHPDCVWRYKDYVASI
jgi:pyrroloquinoline quinone (PQQ) biosynthesis protein C